MKTSNELRAHSSTVLSIHDAVIRARVKHPVFPETRTGKAMVLLEEVVEVLWAAARQGPERTRQELMDVCAVCVRWYEGE